MNTQAAAPAYAGEMGEIADLVGQAAADRLVAAMGGRQIYIPRQPDASTDLSTVFDEAELKRLCYYMSGAMVRVPIGPKSHRTQMQERVVKLLGEGKKASEIAVLAGCSRRTVFQIKAKLRLQRSAA